jgi:hypothetical protein
VLVHTDEREAQIRLARIAFGVGDDPEDEKLAE